MKKFTFLSLFIVLSLVLAACAAQATPEPTQAPAMPEETEEPMEEPAAAAMSIVDIAIQDGRFTTLVTALEAAGLVDTLHQPGIQSFPLFHIVRAPCSVRTLTAMTSAPPVPLTIATEENIHAQLFFDS